ncbi:aminoacetone oxidase family FAD-binding enzyme [Pseudomonas sp. FW306-02-F02-AA]|uniref:NAD(FAD)-utilizing dehydrogenase n=2 Tax=Pseudomonas TaxID=286 RepID=A0A0N9W970_PSEFL|nr:NAD(FAD)-utilizing dehydrogenase [Pseudomonas fluorescens]PMZ04547.1 aminoacetone oxidase family FAD-binding enzyme [Pseudomonas sp. FW306-02-F02-AB]PMZ08729.1 aminoacetone oxidase family FAD-binding enzyme [Pseudomonas sp. FW306-02-H06C]PMZ16274.1 aminoacetone oxidase family FAD-binding enzyme [Pseudomonas sp. FW306-02-F02-AA]PMZ22215.1 aminoacetone oxidase family FAD-binding enzyme [Pseudomonas sp. FW306-02-F08-AA]PMZ27433.1 aminoacetone oxidase family FAD-binding enzyme [Pseudomonas sp. 
MRRLFRRTAAHAMTQPSANLPHHVAIIGGGPAGLMAAEVLSQAGVKVDLYDGMPSVGRKFLLAGVGGMNITHSEAYPAFLARYAERAPHIAPLLREFGAEALCQWIHGLGIETFIGSSGRVFPTDMKAAPLLRAWLKRLRDAGVVIHTRHRWLGWNADGSLRIDSPDGEKAISADALLLALGGGSWSRLGSDGAWMLPLEQCGVALAPLQPSNCGFEVKAWSELMVSKFAGAPLKNIAIGLNDDVPRLGECVITATGIEGSLIYALSAPIRETINQTGSATLHLDLLPGRPVDKIQSALSKPRGSRSMAKHLHSQLGLDGVKAALLRELTPAECFTDPLLLANAIKALPLTLVNTRPLDEAISSAGGVMFEAMNENLMLKQLPGVFCAGEMLDWEAPTGGYLLTACFASGRVAGLGMVEWLKHRS